MKLGKEDAFVLDTPEEFFDCTSLILEVILIRQGTARTGTRSVVADVSYLKHIRSIADPLQQTCISWISPKIIAQLLDLLILFRHICIFLAFPLVKIDTPFYQDLNLAFQHANELTAYFDDLVDEMSPCGLAIAEQLRISVDLNLKYITHLECESAVASFLESSIAEGTLTTHLTLVIFGLAGS
jgi:hypothetical protein